MFFSKPGEVPACGMYSVGHIVLLIITIISIILLLMLTRKKNTEQIKLIIRNTTIGLWILEIIKIAFNLAVGNARNPNNYLPLYYCSIILFAGALSSFAKGKLKKVGDTFIATGAIVGGFFFLFCPNTSLPMYPAFHYISIQSFIFHGAMVYLGILVNITQYVRINICDLKYYVALISVFIFIAYFVNSILGTNFMFISKNFPNTPVEVIYKGTGKLFTLTMSVLQITLPFFMGGILNWLCIKVRKNYEYLLEKGNISSDEELIAK